MATADGPDRDEECGGVGEVGARGGKKRITYCPGLPDTLPDPLPPWLGNLTLVPTPRNIYRDGS